jgi:hypothetical protein
VRAAALARSATGVGDAATAFDGLSVEQKWVIITEIVLSRTGELLRAYPDALDVTAGHRRRRHRSGGGRLIREPCVKFLVSRKWSQGKPGPRDRRIPGRLLAYGGVEGQRRLYAVPTDVEGTEAHAQVRAQGFSVVVAWEKEGIPASSSGALACALRRSTTGETLFSLSCRHVLSLSESFPTSNPANLPVRLEAPAGAVVGATSRIEGPLREASNGRSFDAQLLAVTDVLALRAALAGLGVSTVGRDTVPPHRFKILTPNEPIGATFSAVVRDRPVYTVGTRQIQHEILFESEPDKATDDGSSGSPVVTEDGRILLGMHVAGTGEHQPPLAYMIPAEKLFDPKQYTGVSGPETWTLVPSP